MSVACAQRCRQRAGLIAWALGLTIAFAATAGAADAPVRADRPNALEFPPQEAKFVRFVILPGASAEPCIDELEVYGPEGKRNLALARNGAKASASSCLAGYPIHQVAHLNDGEYGNDHSWIAASSGEEWAQAELPKPATVAKVVFSRDREGQYADRVPTRFEIRLSLDGQQWTTVRKVATTAAAAAVRARRGGFAAKVPPPPPPPRVGQDGSAAPAMGPDLKAPLKDDLGCANLALSPKAKAAASSLLPGHPIHQVAHLNDGLLGNEHCWISNGEPSWAEIDLGEAYWVYRVAFGSDSSGKHRDRAPTAFAILTSPDGKEWRTALKQGGGPAVHARTEFSFEPVQARWVRVALEAAEGGNARLDEVEIYGSKSEGPVRKVRGLIAAQAARSKGADEEQLRYAFLGEEHAWLKTYGRADLSPRLVPYNGRVKEYPRHVGDDALPLPPLSRAPQLDGGLDDACWAEASRGVVRVADPYDFDRGPLVEHEVRAGWKDGDLFLAIRVHRLLSAHVAIVSSADGKGCAVVACTGKELVLKPCEPEAKMQQVDGAFDKSLTCFEMRLPLTLFPDCQTQGLRVGLGMGGKHTDAAGRPVSFVFAPLSIAEVAPCVGRVFRVRFGVPEGGAAVSVATDAAGALTLEPGRSRVVAIPARRGPIGPELDLSAEDSTGERYALHLFRYDPVERALTLLEGMLKRFGDRGLDVRAEREEAARLRKRQEQLLVAEKPDRAAERQAFFEARLAKRRLFFREPELAPMERILFVKRHAFEPSHNYSVLLDSRYRGGGGVYRLEIPRREGRLEPGEARLVELFNAGGGIARNPAASFDLSRVYFGYRPSAQGQFHIYSIGSDGAGLKQLTDGIWHDYWPCPLPDGGLAFISSRCKARYLCWRPEVSVLFRMDADGANLRPLSYANLSEWAPSVMSDGRIIWTRSEYIDKGADFSHTLWSIHPDGSHPELVFGNTIIQPNGYANGREVPGSQEVCCTLISHFGDLNGPIALLDLSKGRLNPKAITSLTPEVPWPGMWPEEECFRDPLPVARDYFLVSHAPRRQFGLYVIDRFGDREVLYLDLAVGSMCPTLLRAAAPPPVLADGAAADGQERQEARVVLVDVYRGIAPAVARGRVKFIRVVEEVRSPLQQLADGQYRRDHADFMKWYASPVDKVSGPSGWPSYVAKASHGLVPVEADGSASFFVPPGKTLYFEALDADLNELQRMRSVVQFQPGENRSCIGCHESRGEAPPNRVPLAFLRPPQEPDPPSWGTGPLSYERVVQPVWDARCVRCHNAGHKKGLDLTGTLDADRIPASYKTLIRRGLVHYLDCGWNSGGNEKREPLTFGSLKSKLWAVLDAGHNGVRLTRDETRRVKCWIDMNCPLWPDYVERSSRPGVAAKPN